MVLGKQQLLCSPGVSIWAWWETLILYLNVSLNLLLQWEAHPVLGKPRGAAPEALVLPGASLRATLFFSSSQNLLLLMLVWCKIQLMENWRWLSLLPHHKTELLLLLLSCTAEPFPSPGQGQFCAAAVGHMGNLTANPSQSC